MSVHAYPDLLRGIAGPVVKIDRPADATLLELIALVPLEHEALRVHLRVRMNGEDIAPELYRLIRPKDQTFITLYVPVHGKSAGQILATVAAIALLGASLYVGAFGLPILGTLFAAGTTGASLLSGALSIGASLLLQGLSAATETGKGGAQSVNEVGVASAQNSFELGAYLQKVIGTRRVAPQMIMPPYTWFDGFDQYVVVAYGLAGPHQIEDVRIGSAAVETDPNIEMEIRAGFDTDTPISFLTQTIIETQMGIVLTDFVAISSSEASTTLDTTKDIYTPQWHRLETRDAPDEAIINFALTGGLFNTTPASDTDSEVGAVTAIRLRLRAKGETIWINLPEFVLRGRGGQQAIRFAVRFVWCDAVDIPSGAAFTANWNGFSWKYNSVADLNGAWVANSYFTASSPIDWEDSQHVAVYLNQAAFPRGRYEIEVIRGATVHSLRFDSTNHVLGSSTTLTSFFDYIDNGATLDTVRAVNRYVREIAVMSLQSVFDEAPFDFTGQPTAVIAIQAKNKNVDQVSCLASGMTEDWNGVSWVAGQVTANPASWYREVLAGSQNAEPLALSLVDEDGLATWHAWCTSEGIEVNAILRGQPVTEVLAQIAQAGFARPLYGPSNGVVIDRRREPVGLITQRNAANFAFSKPFPRLPHALKVNFADEDNEYEVGEITVYADGYNADGSGGKTEATRFDFITYPGLTNGELVEARATRDLRFGKYRARLISFTMDIEHLEHRIGSLVFLETDILGQIGGRGRVREVLSSGGLVTGLKLDEARDFTAADLALASRGVAMRQSDGDILTKQVTSADADLTVVMFTTPFAMPTSGGLDLIGPGTLVATGTLGQEARHVLLWDIAPAAGLTAQVTAIDYAETEIYGASAFSSGFSPGFARGLM